MCMSVFVFCLCARTAVCVSVCVRVHVFCGFGLCSCLPFHQTCQQKRKSARCHGQHPNVQKPETSLLFWQWKTWIIVIVGRGSHMYACFPPDRSTCVYMCVSVRVRTCKYAFVLCRTHDVRARTRCIHAHSLPRTQRHNDKDVHFVGCKHTHMRSSYLFCEIDYFNPENAVTLQYIAYKCTHIDDCYAHVYFSWNQILTNTGP